MRKRTLRAALALILIQPLASLALEDVPAKPAPLGVDPAGLPQEVTDLDGVERRIYRDGRVFIAGQPSDAALRELHERGVTAVVSLRTQEEMDNRERVPYDEAALAAELGIEYVHLPIGGDDQPYRPAVLDGLADVLARHPGPVLLHCTVAWRATNVWVAYLIREEGFSLDDAISRGKAIAFGDEPIELLLDRPIRYVFADEMAAPSEPEPAPELVPSDDPK